MKVVAYALIVISSLLAASVLAFDTGKYPLHQKLDQDGKYYIHWKINTTHIEIAMEVATQGWVGLGFSPNGKMIADSDMVLGWVTSAGKVFFSDRNTNGYTSRVMPKIDASQDAVLVAGEESNGKTYIAFARKFDTCDAEDHAITTGTTKLIFAFGTTDPASEDSVPFHDGGYGSHSLNLRTLSPDDLAVPTGATTVDLLKNNAAVPKGQLTLYHCSTFKLPKVAKKTHLIAVAPMLAAATKDNVHHMLFYKCDTLSDAELAWTGDCYYDPKIPPKVAHCNGGRVLAAWAVGGQLFSYPPEAGLPFLSNTEDVYILLETHYTVPSLNGITDSSGMRFYYTENLRPNDAGIIAFGADTYSIIVPPGVVAKESYVCPGDCTALGIPKDGITVFGNLLHGHTTARKIATRVVRGSKELAPINRDDSYDFNFQKFDHVGPFKLLPGDSIYTECTYDTTLRANTTWGGLSTFDEMCLSYTMYYPAIATSGCYSSIDYQSFVTDAYVRVSKVSGLDITKVKTAFEKAFNVDGGAARTAALLAAGVDLKGEQGKVLLDVWANTQHMSICSDTARYNPVVTATPYWDPESCDANPDDKSTSSAAVRSASWALATAIAAIAAIAAHL